MTDLVLDEVSEKAATGRVSEIYEDIKQTLRTTQVNFLFRSLAVHESYFAAAWEALRPNASIVYFERCADSLRMRMTPPMPEDVPDFEEELEEECDYSEEQIKEINQILDIYNYINPKNLILVDALRGTLGGVKIGGITPGSMPPTSQTVEEEGVLIDNFLVVENGILREQALRELLSSGAYPA
ncbi:MAG: hypothetical protein HOE85_01170, partial [Nitrospinaceae bacterium]|nr:hypothetical protein [Nitrospinaceae bacterium]